MFGFLRRKKAADPVTTPPVTPTGPRDTLAATPADQESAPVSGPASEPVTTSVASAAVIDTPAPTERKRWLGRLRDGLQRTSKSLGSLFTGSEVDESLYDELETALLSCDAGVRVTEHLLATLRARVRQQGQRTPEQVRQTLRELLTELLAPLEAPIDIDRATPLVMMIAGVNGAGKTTSIGKLAHHLQREGKTILLAAGDTFRAAAREQLEQWGERNGVQVISQQGGDPAAVAFDAVSAGIARHTGVVMIDTAGRLPTQANLMQELAKIRRVIGKAMPQAPHESLLVLDGNTGQNMLAQTRAFHDTVGLTGLIVTKLDGTAKGGALIALAYEHRAAPIPVYFIGMGEALEDLQAFSAAEFAEALLGS